MENNIGPKRLVVGAHYGVRDWLAQRVTAIVMAVYTVVLLVAFLTGSDFGYKAGPACSRAVVQAADLRDLPVAGYHAWVGIRNIWMDYIKPVGLRLTLQVLTILWLVGCAFWAVQILWRV
jgi:succinate dehydrogenase / fumarate reductase membrane anchor subunit